MFLFGKLANVSDRGFDESPSDNPLGGGSSNLRRKAIDMVMFKLETDDALLVLGRNDDDEIVLDVIQSPHLITTKMDDDNLRRLRDRCDVLLNRKREDELVP